MWKNHLNTHVESLNVTAYRKQTLKLELNKKRLIPHFNNWEHSGLKMTFI